MTSLSETYGGKGRSEVDPRQLSIGAGLFVGGALLLVAGILAAAEVLVPSGYTSGSARHLGGILGGFGVPLVLLGVMTVLPANRRTRAAAVVGAAIMGFGVVVFSQAYPHHWVNGPSPELVDLTLPTAGVYFLGAATTLWCVFVGVANFKTRNDPGGTVTMEVTHKGETKIIEVERDQIGSRGGIGLLGGTPDGNVETQTNRPAGDTEAMGTDTDGSDRSTNAGMASSTGLGGTSERSRDADGAGSVVSGGRSSAGVSDGGDTERADLTSPLDEGSPETPSGPDRIPSGPSRSTAESGEPRFGSGVENAGPKRNGAPGVDGTETTAAARDGPGDTYCGNCAEFDYVRTDDGMRPYCGHYDELMDDMDACDQWTPR
ncbi:MAG: NADH-quinone oxidoreductase subunit J [Halorubrum sp.]